jgi:hypothetical protein
LSNHGARRRSGRATKVMRCDGSILETAPRFFGLTRDAHADLSVMTAARMFDEHPKAISIYKIFSASSQHAQLLPPSAGEELKKVIADARLSLKGLKPILKAIRVRRNQDMAHADAESLANSLTNSLPRRHSALVSLLHGM